MKALPKILTIGTFEPCNLVMGEVEYETPPSRRQRRAMIKRTKRFCAKHCDGSQNRIYLEFQGSKMRVRQYSACTKMFSKFHFVTLLNQKLGGVAQGKVPQEPASAVETVQLLTTVSAA